MLKKLDYFAICKVGHLHSLALKKTSLAIHDPLIDIRTSVTPQLMYLMMDSLVGVDFQTLHLVNGPLVKAEETMHLNSMKSESDLVETFVD